MTTLEQAQSKMIRSKSLKVNQEAGDALTRKALLTLISNLLQLCAKFVTGFVCTPIIVTGLGGTMYGAWGIISRTTGFLETANMNPIASVRILLGITQHDDDIQLKRRIVGAAILQVVMLLPLVAVLGSLFVWFTPLFIKVGTTEMVQVRCAMALVIAAISINQFWLIPNGVLVGQNLGYRRMGLNSLLVLFCGGLNVLGILAGWGIVSLAITTLIGFCLVGVVQWWLAKKYVPWFGVARPSRDEFIKSFKINTGGGLNVIAFQLFSCADVILIGKILDPQAVTMYLMTTALARFFVEPLQQLYKMSYAPSLNYMLGTEDWPRLNRTRTEITQLAILIQTALAIMIIIVNACFVTTWVGQKFFYSTVITAVFMGIQLMRSLTTLDAVLLEGMLEIRSRLIATLLWAFVGLMCGVLFMHTFGLTGMAVGLLIGHCGRWLHFQFILTRTGKMSFRTIFINLGRPLVFGISMLIGVTWIRMHYDWGWLKGWGHLALASPVIASIGIAAFLMVGINATSRQVLVARSVVLFNAMKKFW